MRAMVVTPKKPDSGRLLEVTDPQPRSGEVLVHIFESRVGRDGRRDPGGQYGEAPPSDDYLIIGHESLGQVERVTNGAEGLSPDEDIVRVWCSLLRLH